MAKPKKAKTAYICFVAANAKKVVEEDKIPYKEAIKKLSQKWNEMSEEQKAPFKEEAEMDS
jgi:hypothetical protein